MMLTATNSFIAEPVAGLFAIDHLLATRLEKINNRYTGRYLGTPTFQQGKVTNLQQWLNQHPGYQMGQAVFFSDSHNDIPLLEAVGKAVAVHPDKQLEAEAKKRNWPIIYFSQ